MTLVPCSRCSRHIRFEAHRASACPFCGAESSADDALPASDSRTRWRWLSMSAVALATGLPIAACDFGSGIAMYGAPCLDENCGMPDMRDAGHTPADASVRDGGPCEHAESNENTWSSSAPCYVDATVDGSADVAVDASADVASDASTDALTFDAADADGS